MKLSFWALALLLTANGPALLPGFTTAPAAAQQKLPLTLEDIMAKPTFRAAAVPGGEANDPEPWPENFLTYFL